MFPFGIDINTIKSRLGNIFFENEWQHLSEVKAIYDILSAQQVKNGFKEVKICLEAKKENAYNYIERYLTVNKYPENYIGQVQFSRDRGVPLDIWKERDVYFRALEHYKERLTNKLALPGYTVTLASDNIAKVLRLVVDLNENGYVTTVVPRSYLTSQPEQIKSNIKKKDSFLTIGDYYWDELNPLVPEHDDLGNLIGYYAECLASPIHTTFKSLPVPDYLSSHYSRVFGCIKPYLTKSRLFSLKIVDESYYPKTIIIPEIHRLNAHANVGDKFFLQVLATYIKDEKIHEYGTAVSDEDKYDEYLLWQLNNHYFLGYELKKWKWSYTEMLTLKGKTSFQDLLELYELACSAYDLNQINEREGEQNNGIIINRLLKAQNAILYHHSNN